MWAHERPEDGLTSQQLSVLSRLFSAGPMTPGEIAVAERVQPQTLTRTLTALEAGGLITREMDTADRRRSVLAITPVGLRKLSDDTRLRDRWLAVSMAELLTPVERGVLQLAGALMERIAEADVAPDPPTQPLAGRETNHASGSDLRRTTQGGNMSTDYRNGKLCYVEIPAEDIAASAQFYVRAFGWTVRQRDDGAVAFDDGTGGVGGTWVTGRQPSPQPGILLYIMVENMEASIEAVLTHGGEIVQPVGGDAPEVTARFRDPAGNVLGLFQEPTLAAS
jgi:predicted enzyme related to lactoylglutathione lyase/DNA-binding MarR family transcriptional regulator